jgi:YggT family protein
MVVLGNVLIGLGQALYALLQLYLFLMIGRAIISWVDANPYNPIVRFIVQATEPPRRFVARLLPSSLRQLPIDVAFLVLFGLIIFLQYAVAQTMIDVGYGMKPAPPGFRGRGEVL